VSLDLVTGSRLSAVQRASQRQVAISVSHISHSRLQHRPSIHNQLDTRSMEQSKHMFAYKPLRTGRNLEIRLLRLHPGMSNDRIQCGLHHVRYHNRPGAHREYLQYENAPPMTEFTALSYVWGNPEETKPIDLGYIQPQWIPFNTEILLKFEELALKWYRGYVPKLLSIWLMSWTRRSWANLLVVVFIYGFGILLPQLPGFAFHVWFFEMFLRKDKYEEFLVTSNLEAALRHLRYRHQPRFLWVDALCINQSDLQERASQVLLMDFIYRMAFNVHVWLGPIPSTPEARPVIKHFNERALRSAVRSTFSIRTSHTKATHEAARHLIASFPWWRRVWIIQEVTLASKDPIMQCGNITFKYRKFLQSALQDIFGSTDILRIHKLVNDSYNRKSFLSPMSPQQQLLLYLGITSGHLEATNPRDRIFGLLGLVKDTSRSSDFNEIVAHGYEEGTEAIYGKTAVWMLKDTGPKSRPLHLLDYGPSDTPGQPTWAPSWDSKTPPLKNSHTVSGRTNFIISPSCMRLDFRALLIGTVTSVIRMEAHNVRTKDSLEHLLLYIDTFRKRFDGVKPRKVVSGSDGFDFKALLDYMTGASYEHSKTSASDFARRLWNLHVSEETHTIAPSRSIDFPNLYDAITVPRLGAFFRRFRSLVSGPDLFGMVWEDFIPSNGKHQEEVFLIPECRSGLALRAEGHFYKFMYRVYLFECCGSLWEAGKDRRRRDQVKQISLV
jgi:hypothetical protein